MVNTKTRDKARPRALPKSQKHHSHGATLNTIHSILSQIRCNQLARKRLAAGLSTIASLIWLACLTLAKNAGEFTPWLVVFFGGGLWALAACYFAQEEQENLFLRVRPAIRVSPAKGVSLAECLAFSYLTFSLLISLCLILNALGLVRRPVIARQIVDIELTSKADFANHHELLPSTEEKTTLRKQTGATDKLESQLVTQPPVLKKQLAPHGQQQPTPRQQDNSNPMAKNQVAKNQALKLAKSEVTQKQTATLRQATCKLSIGSTTLASTERKQLRSLSIARSNTYSLLRANSPNLGALAHSSDSLNENTLDSATVNTNPPKSRQVAPIPQTNSTNVTNDDNNPMGIEEVAPAQLVEVTDNEGDNGADLWQKGGRSSGGKGAASNLSKYLKELHKKLKRAWAPPTGSSRKAEILFRLNREGHLCSLSLISSSGDHAVDDSALKAISSSAPFGILPNDYSAQFIDIRYTFNYTADELTEVANIRSHH